MTATGWTGEPPEDDVLRAAPGGFASFIASARPDPGEGRTLEQVLGRSLRPDKPEVHRDPDEVAANLMARGYAPGQLSDLSRRLGDAQAELGEEQEKIERGRKRQERIMRDHQAGKITVFDIARMQDFDEGDLDRAARLERRVANLRRQLKEAAALISPQREAPADPFEGASRRAHDAFVEVTRAAMGAAREGRFASRERRPFVSRGAGPAADCAECQAPGATRAESAAMHADMASRSAGGTGEIVRVCSADGMGQPSRMSSGVIVR